MSQTKQSTRKPASQGAETSQKKSTKDIHAEYGFKPLEEVTQSGLSEMDIDEELKQELSEKEFAYRFINFKHYKQYGFHKRGWKPYKRESSPSNTVLFNIDPNGFMVRGDLVLAVKPTSYNEADKRRIDAINKRKEGIIDQRSKEFREKAQELGFGSESD